MTIDVLHSFPVWLPQTQTWMYNQLRYLPPEIAAHVVCERTENLDQFGVPNIHCLADIPAWRRHWEHGLRRLRMRRHPWFTAEVARMTRADIVHSHFGNVGWADMPAVHRAGVAHVVTFYGLDVTFLPRHDSRWRVRYRALFDHVDAVLCEGEHMAGSIVSLGCPAHKVQVQHLGVALEDIPFEPCDWQSGGPLRVLIAASFREKKGIPDALEALGRLRDRMPLEITVIGDSGDDPRGQDEKRKILATIEQYGLTRQVRMLGYQPHARLLEEARRHHIFLSPSLTASDGDTEGGAPVSLIEMAASGMILVSTMHCDIPGIISHGKTGLLSAERDIEGLVRNLQWLVEHTDQWSAMRIAARKHVEASFDAPIQAGQLASIYRNLLEKSSE